MEIIVSYLIGAALLTAWAVGGIKKIIKAIWPKCQLDAWVVVTITAAANFAVAWAQFGTQYSWWPILVASLVVATGAKIGYDVTRGIEKTHAKG